jgi:hypothetical protein
MTQPADIDDWFLACFFAEPEEPTQPQFSSSRASILQIDNRSASIKREKVDLWLCSEGTAHWMIL